MGAHGATGTFGHDLAHLLGGALVVLAFALIGQRRLRAMPALYAAEAWVLAAAAAWQGWVQSSPELYATAAIALGARASPSRSPCAPPSAVSASSAL